MAHVFGPVNSRRLGRSLGVDLFVRKVCNLNCIYCEVGPTAILTGKRDNYVAVEEILEEIKAFCLDPARLNQVDVVTITASGEPTLHSGLGRIISEVKAITGKKVVVLTNGTTLHDRQVREELMGADLVIPSLDSARSDSFRKLNRPAQGVSLPEVIEGLIQFSRMYHGELWLEILLAKSVNDTGEDLDALAEALGRIAPDRIQLNTVARPPLEKYAIPVSSATLQRFADAFSRQLPNVPVDILSTTAGVEGELDHGVPDELVPFGNTEEVLEKIVEMLKRRPCTAADINRIFHLGGPDKVKQSLEPLVRSGRLELRSHGEEEYYH